MVGKAKAIRDLPNTGAPNFLQRVRELLQIAIDDASDHRVVTVDDLINAGMVQRSVPTLNGASAPLLTAITPPAYVPDLSIPPTPTGLMVTSGVTALFIEHDDPTFTVGHGYLRTVIYGAPYSGSGPLPTYTEGVTPILTEFVGVGSFPVDPATQWHIWAKWVSVDGVQSAVAGGTNGVTTTSAGVDDKHIVKLVASKIKAGSIAVGEQIKSFGYVAGDGGSGWSINGSGAAEFNTVTVRGTVYATSGKVGGNTIDAGGVYSQNWNGVAGPTGTGWAINAAGTMVVNSLYARGQINTGAFNGYVWPAAGAGGGAHISSSGLLLGSANDGRYFCVEAGGNVYAPGFSIVNGAASFSGALSAASGTFAGSLTSQVVNTNNIVGAAVTTAYVNSGVSETAVTVPVAAGDKSLMIFFDPGGQWSGTPTENPTIFVNGSAVLSAAGLYSNNCIFYSIQDPGPGNYNITGRFLGSGVTVRLGVLHTKR